MTEQQTGPYSIRHLDTIGQVDAAQWNAVAGAAYPFLRHEFLHALEVSGCIDTATGWQPCHLVLENDAGELAGLMPLYSKTHSYGEYVFDWSWADAYNRHGMAYYPKLVSAIPFTPCAGPRLALAPGVAEQAAVDQILNAVIAKAARERASSWHMLFPDAAQKTLLEREQLLLRSGCQYQWFNQDFADFEAFLATLNSRKRKNLRKERRRVQDQGIRFRVLEGPDITAEHWRRFYDFYQHTYLVRGRPPYLNPAFFTLLGRNMPEHLMLVMAEDADECVAGALFFKGEDTLYGRYRGSNDAHRFLHFEACYYQGIDYCIRHGYSRFDSGAQGEHKIQRGFKPVHTWSLHWIQQPEFMEAIARFVREEADYINHYVEQASEFLPFRKDLELDADRD